MTDTKLPAWVQNWIEVGPILATIKRRELEAMTDADVRAHVAALFGGQYPVESAQRAESGLVEQQRWFAKAHRRP
ncbi:MAG: hypothetical protein EXR29_06485 [Betaproteobacteria bacterium]|nr:hypothetical protein [Betaproteobacteria bacterium]